MTRSSWTPLLAVALLMMGGTFMAQPFLMLTLVDDKQVSSVTAGSLLAAMLAVQQITPLAIGHLGERLGYRRLIALGLLARALGYGLLGSGAALPTLATGSVLIGLGGALYHTLIGAYVIDQPHDIRRTAVTWLNQLANLGAILGPLLGSLVIAHGSTTLLVIAALILCLGAVILLFSPGPAGRTTEPDSRHGFAVVLGDRRFLLFTTIMTAFWVLFTQLSVAFPLAAAAIDGQSAAGIVWFVNGSCCFVAMFVLRPLFQRRQPIQLIRLGLLIMAAGMLLTPLYPGSLAWICLCVATCAAGETMIFPAVDLAIGTYSDQSGLRGTYYGVYELSYALGGAIGSLLGSTLSVSTSPLPLWLSLAAIGLIGALALKAGETSLAPA